MSTDGTSGSPTSAFVHWHESCGREDLLDSRDAYQAGWDFPPHMAIWGVISPRTCPTCTIKTTVWWAIEKRSIDALTLHQRRVVGRIVNEAPPGTGGARWILSHL